MAATAVSLSVDPAVIVVEARPRNTAQEAEFIARRAAGRPVVLVTSASHMPRAVRLFEAWGMDVIPAPVYYLAPDRSGQSGWMRRMVPSAGNARKAAGAVYEFLAGVRARVTGNYLRR